MESCLSESVFFDPSGIEFFSHPLSSSMQITASYQISKTQ